MDLSNVVFIESNQKEKEKKEKKSWTEVPPTANEPLTKRRYGKVYHYCHYCKYWGLHQPGKGKNCKQVEPLTDLKSAFGNNRSFQSAAWFGDSGICTGTSQSNVFGSSSNASASRNVASEVPNNPPFGAPLPGKKSVFSDHRNSSSSGWGGAPAKGGIFGGGPSSLVTTAKPFPFVVGVTGDNQQRSSLFGANSNWSASTTKTSNQCGKSSFGTGNGLFDSTNSEKPFGSGSGFGSAAKSLNFSESRPNMSKMNDHNHSSFSSFGAISVSKETHHVESQSLFDSRNHSSFSVFGAPTGSKAMHVPQPLFASSRADSFRLGGSSEPAKTSSFGVFGKPNAEDQNSSSLFASNGRSFAFGNSSAVTPAARTPEPNPVPRQAPTAFPFAPQSESGNSFNFPTSPSISRPSTQPISAPPTAQRVAAPSAAECAAVVSRQSSAPSFLYDHYPSHVCSSAVPTAWVAPSSYYASDVYSLQVTALEAKRQEVAQYLVR